MKKEKLPSEQEFQLLSLIFEERRGNEIVQRYAAEFGKLSYPAMFTVMRRLEGQGWVKRSKKDFKGRDVQHFKIDGPGITAWNKRQRQFSELGGLQPAMGVW